MNVLKCYWSAVLVGVLSMLVPVSAQTGVLFPDDFEGGWTPYIGQTVTFDQPLYLIGRGTTGSEVYLSYKRLRTPMEECITDTEEYASMEAENRAATFVCRFSSGNVYRMRLGQAVTGLTAEVTGECALRVYSSIESWAWTGNERPVARPDLGDASLVVCGANLQNYFPFYWCDYKSNNAPQNQADAEMQHAKIVSALVDMDADIYALCELQDTCTAVEHLAMAMNGAVGVPDRYGYVADYKESGQIAAGRTGYVYRTDKVSPYLSVGFPDPSNYVYSRHQYVQAFDELGTGERFVLSINHFKAKSENSDAQRVTNMRNLINFLDVMGESDYYGDEDVLVMGDLNAYSREEPLRMIEEKGFVNQLRRYNPEGYSYSYNREVGYIDHALASASLSPQVTGAAAYHFNADEPGTWAWSGSDPTPEAWRYSDHDPILVGLRLHSDNKPGEDCQALSVSVPFAQSLAPFTAISVSGKKSWYNESNTKTAYINGYGDTEDNEDWLISPGFDFSRMSKATVSFTHAIDYGRNQWTTNQTFWVSNDYIGGNPASATWTQVVIPVYPAGNNANSYATATVEIPKQLLGKNTTFAFKYLSNSSVSAKWYIKDLWVSSECDNSGWHLAENPVSSVHAEGRSLFVSHVGGLPVAVYDTAGHCLLVRMNVPEETCIELSAGGVYIVRVGDEVHKVVVE